MVRLTRQERRAQILGVAVNIFAEKGLMGTRTREIAEACDINEALIYKHFDSKEDLFREAMLFQHSMLVNDWSRIVGGDDTGRELLLRTGTMILENLFNMKNFSANILHGISASVNDLGMRAMVYEWLDTMHDKMAEIVRMGMKDGSLRNGLDPDMVSHWIRGFIYITIVHTAIEKTEPLNLEACTELYDKLVRQFSS